MLILDWNDVGIATLMTKVMLPKLFFKLFDLLFGGFYHFQVMHHVNIHRVFGGTQGHSPRDS